MQRNRVLLPEPLAPQTTLTLPRLIDRQTSRSTTVGPNAFVTPSKRMMMSCGSCALAGWSSSCDRLPFPRECQGKANGPWRQPSMLTKNRTAPRPRRGLERHCPRPFRPQAQGAFARTKVPHSAPRIDSALRFGQGLATASSGEGSHRPARIDGKGVGRRDAAPRPVPPARRRRRRRLRSGKRALSMAHALKSDWSPSRA